MRMRMTRIWEILTEFKDSCRCRGWKTSESEDWVEIDDNFHNFLWAKGVHISSFKRITSKRKCVVREGISYRVVEASCTAWLFSEKPSENLLKTVLENPDFASRTALYDLSLMLEGKNSCVRLNLTDSPVFQEFESFLQNELKVKIEPLSPIHGSGIGPDSYAVLELA